MIQHLRNHLISLNEIVVHVLYVFLTDLKYHIARMFVISFNIIYWIENKVFISLVSCSNNEII